MYKTILTSQGTITLPAALRRKYNLKAGETLLVEDDGKITVTKPYSIGDVRARNVAFLKKSGQKLRPYKSGDGFAAHMQEKYGKK